MGKKRFLALLVCMAILSIGCSQKKEVVYQGKPLSTWIKMLKDDNPATKLAAIHAIGEIGAEAREAIPYLVETIRVTRNRDRKFLFSCTKALLAMGQEIVPYMITMLQDKDWEMRGGCAWMLGKLGPDAKDAVPALTKALNDENIVVRGKAADALKKIKAEGVSQAPDHEASATSEK